MEKSEATQIIHNALAGYVEDCAGADTPEANEIQEAWELIKEPEFSKEEVDELKIILGYLDVDSRFHTTKEKVMKALGI